MYLSQPSVKYAKTMIRENTNTGIEMKLMITMPKNRDGGNDNSGGADSSGSATANK
jgi:hypothetical protein